MKVKDLLAKVHLISGQNIKLIDHSTVTTFFSKDRYAFGLNSNVVERLMKLKVDSFTVCDAGLTVHAG